MKSIQSPRRSTVNRYILQHPRISLAVVFFGWKLLLFLVVLASPSPAYDTSTAILLRPAGNLASETSEHTFLQRLSLSVADKSTRWDAIYFAKVAERGYANEQEWAFSWGFTQSVKAVSRVSSSLSPLAIQQGHPTCEILAALLISNSSNAIATLLLYELTRKLFHGHPKSRNIAVVTAMLHIVCPAGIFAAAPYSESLYSMLAFLGYYTFSVAYLARRRTQNPVCSLLLTLSSAASFSLACMVRSNGILNGLLFLSDFSIHLYRFWKRPQIRKLIQTFILGIGGLIIGMGLVIPQVIAWNQLCSSSTEMHPAWCNQTLPSIYTWVQSRYWNVGLFKYWTFSNIPLFFLASPTITIMIVSGIWALKQSREPGDQFHASREVLAYLAVPQILLAAMATTNYHVQVITRMSSGYVVWYWWIAHAMMARDVGEHNSRSVGFDAKWTIRWMVMYAMIQAVLYAGFLPPA